MHEHASNVVVCLVSFETRIDFIHQLSFLSLTLEDFSRGENYVYLLRLFFQLSRGDAVARKRVDGCRKFPLRLMGGFDVV